jgi:hypothetical protein
MVSDSKLNNPQTIWLLFDALARWCDQRQEKSENETRIESEAAGRFTRLKSEFFDKPLQDFKFPERHYLYLPADDKANLKLPILQAKFENQGGLQVFRLRIGILVRDIDGNHHGIGVRFESPEGVESIHDYPHAQWFFAFEKGQESLPGCPTWLPDVHPAIPIKAEHAVDIFCCALKSLYGARSEVLKALAAKIQDKSLSFKLGKETVQCVGKWAELS